MVLSIRLFCLSVAKMRTINVIFSIKTKQSRPVVSTDGQQEVLHVVFKEPTIGPLKFKMVHVRRLEIVKSPYLNEKHPMLMKFGTQQQIWNSTI